MFLVIIFEVMHCGWVRLAWPSFVQGRLWANDMLFSRLNFSSQSLSNAPLLSVRLQAWAKASALSMSISSFIGILPFWYCFTKFESAVLRSGTRPLVRFSGDWPRLLMRRYLSFRLTIFETVL
jgi:hypothetical protein